VKKSRKDREETLYPGINRDVRKLAKIVKSLEEVKKDLKKGRQEEHHARINPPVMNQNDRLTEGEYM